MLPFVILCHIVSYTNVWYVKSIFICTVPVPSIHLNLCGIHIQYDEFSVNNFNNSVRLTAVVNVSSMCFLFEDLST